MSTRIRAHIRSNVVGYIAIFLFAVGGSATALTGSGRIDHNDLRSHVVHTGKIHNNAVTGGKVAPNSLTGTDINESSLGEVPSATLGGLGGESDGGPCDPETSAFTTCTTVSTTLPAPSRVLVIGHVRAEPDTGGGNGGGSCGVAEPVLRTIPVFVNGGQTDVIAISGITGIVGPGPVSFALKCNETASGIRYFDSGFSFVALSPSVAP